MFRIYPYKMGSASVGKLKTALDALIIKLENSSYRYRDGHTIINWGNSRRPSWMTADVPVLNKPEAVAVASDKLETLDLLEDTGVPTVEFTTDVTIAQDWVDIGNKVFVRHELHGHSGAGIEVVEMRGVNSELVEEMNEIFDEYYNSTNNENDRTIIEELQRTLDGITPVDIPVVPEAPLYTLGVNNQGEYRVHVLNGEVILYQKKSRRVDENGSVITADVEEADIRNLASNWVYRTGNLNRLERIEQLAIDAIEALGLDFGAVDIIMDNEGVVRVLEVNTAPGISNTETANAYVDAFLGLA